MLLAFYKTTTVMIVAYYSNMLAYKSLEPALWGPNMDPTWEVRTAAMLVLLMLGN